MNNHTTTQNLPQFSDPPQGSIIMDMQRFKALLRDRTIQYGILDQWVAEAFDRFSTE